MQSYKFKFKKWQATQQGFQEYIEKLSDDEIERAKRRIYIELFQHESGTDITQAIANHHLYFGRRVFRSEIAYRVAAIDKQVLLACLKKWIHGKKPSITLWGNTKYYEEKI